MTTRDIALRSDFPLDVESQMQTAKLLAQAGVLPGHLRQQPANIMAIGMAARALDIPTWTALQQVVPIDGKVSIQADLMRALVLRAGHKFRVISASPTEATVVVIRHDDPDFEHEVTVKMDEIPAELTRKSNWQNYPADMLVARATSKVCRRSCSDVLNGMIYTPDELGADVDDDGTVTATPPAGSTPASEAAQALRAAAEAEAATHTKAEDVVDAEVVEPGQETANADPEPDEAAPENVDTTTGEVFPESAVDDPFAGRTIHNVTPLRKALFSQAAERFGEDQWEAEIEQHFGEPHGYVDTAKLREFLIAQPVS